MYDPSDDLTSRRGGELSEAALTALAERERTRVVAPLTEWHTLAAALRDEGVIRPPAAARPTGETTVAFPIGPQRRNPVYGWVTRSLAGAALLGIGIVAGTGLTVGREIAVAIKQDMVASDSAGVGRAGPPRPDAGAPNAGTTVAAADGARPGGDHEAVARHTGHGGTVFASVAEARQVFVEAQGVAQRASAYLAARDTGGAQIVGDPEMVYQVRLAALDRVAAAAQRALKDAPHDPMINQYYMSTIGARQATLQQLGQVLPAGVQLKHY